MLFSRALFVLPVASAAANLLPPNDRVLYSAIETLTLISGELTTARRLPAVPQTQCAAAPEWCELADLSVLRCHKDGHSYDPESVQWLCEARLPKEFDLGLVTIGCEGYDTADDAWVLRGSCGATYKLVLTAAGKEKFGKAKEDKPMSMAAFILIVAVVAVIAVFFVYAISQNNEGPSSYDRPPPYTVTDESEPSNGSYDFGNGSSSVGHHHEHHHHHHHHHHNGRPRRRSSSRETRPLLDSHDSKGYGVTSNR